MAAKLFEKARLKGNIIILGTVGVLVLAFLMHSWARLEGLFNGQKDFLAAINVKMEAGHSRVLCLGRAMDIKFERVHFLPAGMGRREAEKWLGFVWDVNPLTPLPDESPDLAKQHWVAFQYGPKVITHYFLLGPGRVDLSALARPGGWAREDAVFAVTLNREEGSPFTLAPYEGTAGEPAPCP